MSATATLTAIFEAQDRISSTLSGIDRRGNSLTNTFKKVATAAAAAFSTAKVVQFGKECATAAVQFESSMNEVFTLIPGASAEAMGKMQQDLKDFSKEMGVLTTEAVPALYQALSAGVSQDTVFDFLETANKAAVGGVTTLETAVDGLSSVVNAYGEDALSAQTASDLMFTTVRLGKTTFEELAGSLYNVVPTAVGAGIAFSDISAALAAMTAQGVPTSVATTQLRQAIVELSKAGTDTDETFRAIAGKGFKDFVSEGGNLQEAFQLLENHAKETGVGVNDLFGSVEAGNAVLSLTGQGTAKFTQAMTEMQSAAGATDAAFGTMEGGMDRKLKKMEAAWEVAKINIGGVVVDALLPIFEFVAENIDGIAGGVQTAFSVLGNAIQSVWKIAKPVLQWVQKNPDTVATALAGIGTAIVTYKVANGIIGVAGALKTFNLAFLASPVGIITAVAAALVAFSVATKKNAENLKKANLAEHFGDITLSMEELESVAKRIVRTDSIGKLEKSLSALDEVESLAEGIGDAVEVMDRTHWKVSIGLELTDAEQQEYRSAVTSFISDTQSILEQKQYALNIALEVFAGDDANGQSIIDSVNSFYLNNQQQVAELGTKLQETVNEAFSDGLLTIDEVKEITELQQQISSITQKLADAQFESQLDLLDIKFSGAELTPESFQALQEQLAQQVETAVSSYDESLTMLIANAKVMLADGAITPEEYEQQVATFKQQYLENVGDIELRASAFQTNTIVEQYGAELEAAAPAFQETTSQWLDSVFASMPGATNGYIETWLKGMGGEGTGLKFSVPSIDESTKAALSDLYAQLAPSVEQMETLKQQYIDAGKQVPQSLLDGINSAEAIGALSGDQSALYSYFGNLIANNPEYLKLLDDAKANGAKVPEELAAAIESNQYLINNQVSAAYTETDGIINSMFGKGFTVDVPVTINPQVRVNGGGYNLGIPGHAAGTTDAESAYIAGENGPELILGAPGSTVFPTSETNKILSAMEDPLDVEAPDLLTGRYDEYSREDRNVTLRLEGAGELKIGRGASKDEVVEVIMEYIRPVLMSVLQQEIFEEGDLSYEF